MNMLYRLQQFWHLLRARPLEPQALQEVKRVLSAQELKLFRRHAVADRRHAYRVMRTLLARGEDDPDLLAAALLHDVGKTRYRLRLWERVVGALGEILCPGCVKDWAQGRAQGWRRPFVIRSQHGAWGAKMAQAAGSSARTVRLIRHHQDKAPALPGREENRLLRCLQQADDLH